MIKERWVLVSIIIILAACVAYLAWHRFEGVQKEKEPAATTMVEAPVYAGVVAQEKPVLLEQKFIGTVVPVHTVDILPYISGFVDKVVVKGGQKVQEGDVLFVLQQKQYLAQKEAAAANVQSAEAALKNAEIYLNRIKKTKSQAISQTELDNAQTSYDTAFATLKAQKAKLLSAEVNYDYTVIKAPISGIVGNIAITKGNYVAPAGQPLARIIQQTPVRVAFSISNKEYLNVLDSGQSLFDEWVFKLQTANGKIYPFTGVFQYMDNEIKQNTSGLTVYVDFENPDGALLSNAYVEVIAEKKVNGIALDKNLIHKTQEGAYAYVVRQNKIERVPLVLGLNSARQSLVLKGLNAGDYVLKGAVPENMLGTPAKTAVLQN